MEVGSEEKVDMSLVCGEGYVSASESTAGDRKSCAFFRKVLCGGREVDLVLTAK